ncbi:MAG: hypothetical protein HUU15_05030 [Candidatus Brocadiae bacterium]|nr:hypothetical protein [Candidatus Brocadiia bacterium]
MTRLCAVVVLLLSPLALTAQEGSDPGGGEPPEFASDPAAAELLSKVEQKALGARTLVLKLTKEVEQHGQKGQFSDEIFLKRDGNKVLVKVDGHFGEGKARLSLLCDGKTTRQTGDRGEREMPAAAGFEGTVRRLLILGGVMPALEMAAGMPPEELARLEAFGVKFLGDETIGETKVRVIAYLFGSKRGMRMEEKVWVDEATQTILKREMKDPTGANRVTETYMEISLDKEIEDSTFVPGK